MEYPWTENRYRKEYFSGIYNPTPKIDDKKKYIDNVPDKHNIYDDINKQTIMNFIMLVSTLIYIFIIVFMFYYLHSFQSLLTSIDSKIHLRMNS